MSKFYSYLYVKCSCFSSWCREICNNRNHGPSVSNYSDHVVYTRPTQWRNQRIQGILLKMYSLSIDKVAFINGIGWNGMESDRLVFRCPLKILGVVHNNPNSVETTYFVTWIRLDSAY